MLPTGCCSNREVARSPRCAFSDSQHATWRTTGNRQRRGAAAVPDGAHRWQCALGRCTACNSPQPRHQWNGPRAARAHVNQRGVTASARPPARPPASVRAQRTFTPVRASPVACATMMHRRRSRQKCLTLVCCMLHAVYRMLQRRWAHPTADRGGAAAVCRARRRGRCVREAAEVHGRAALYEAWGVAMLPSVALLYERTTRVHVPAGAVAALDRRSATSLVASRRVAVPSF